MEKRSWARIWRCIFIHRNGYEAPRFYVETSRREFDLAKKEAIQIAKGKSRLADFPDQWFVRVTFLDEETLK